MNYKVNEKVNVIGRCKYSGQNVIITSIHIQFNPIMYTCKATNDKEILLRADEIQSIYAHDMAMLSPERVTNGMRIFNASDHQFSEYLKDCDIDWTFTSVKSNPPSTHYFTRYGQLIAVVIYNNQESTRQIFIPII